MLELTRRGEHITVSNTRRVMQPIQRVAHHQANCPECGEMSRVKLRHSVSSRSSLARTTLSELGIPAYDMLSVRSDQQERIFLLAGDRQAVLGQQDAVCESRQGRTPDTG